MTQDRRAGARRLARPAASLGGPRRGHGLDLLDLRATFRVDQARRWRPAELVFFRLGLDANRSGTAGAEGQDAQENFRNHDCESGYEE